MYKSLFTQNKKNIEGLFTESFLNQVPIANIMQIINNYKNQLGQLKSVERTSDGYLLIFEKGEAPSKINVNQNNKIAGLWFGNITLYEDDYDQILSEFKKLDSDISISILKDNETKILTYNENKPMAVGSTFKLYVLKALYEQIEKTEKSWTDIVRLDEDNISLPSGQLQNWPIGSPLTVKSLANLMISISDNTATDHLIDYVGRNNIENLVTSKNIPFLKTIELFQLKYGANKEIQNQYIEGNISKKRSILEEITDIDVNINNITGDPVFINDLEWFFSTNELSTLIYELKDAEELFINSGLVAKEKWHKAGYKGGSEAGVLQYTHLLQKSSESSIYTISVTANSDSGVNTEIITKLTTRLISLIASE